MPADMKTTAPGSDARSSGERDKALNLVLGQIERNFGKGSIMRLGDASRMRVETISTGALTLDLALGGGYPKGRVVEIYGPESSGKTTLTLHAIAEVQKRGGVAALRDRRATVAITEAFEAVGVPLLRAEKSAKNYIEKKFERTDLRMIVKAESSWSLSTVEPMHEPQYPAGQIINTFGLE